MPRNVVSLCCMVAFSCSPALATVPTAYGQTSLNIVGGGTLGNTSNPAIVSELYSTASAAENVFRVALASPVNGGTFTNAPVGYISASSVGAYGSGSATHASSNVALQSNLLGAYARSQTDFFYFLRVLGPSGIAVPLRVDTLVYGADDGFVLSNAGGNIGISMDGRSDFLLDQCYSSKAQPNSACIATTFEMETRIISVRPNEAIRVRLTSYAQVASHRDPARQGDPSFSSENPLSASYYVDPYFQIDSAFADKSLYALEFSAGVSNNPIAAIPDVDTWMSIMFGFGVVGLTLRRQRRFAAFA